MAANVNNQIRLYETRTYLKNDNVTGDDAVEFYVVSGSRLLISLQVISADPGVICTLDVGNRADNTVAFESLGQGQVTDVGSVKRIYSDFYNQFNVSVNVAGGNATYKVFVALFDNASTTRIENAQIDVSLDHTVDSLGHFDSVRIGDGQYILDINPDGSINVRMDNAADETPVNPYDESPAVPAGAETPVLTYVVPAGKIAFLYRVEASGENIARYKVRINGAVLATRRTHHGSGLTTEFDFTTPNKRAVELQEGDTIEILALHNRPAAGDFEARAQLLLKDAP